MIHFCSNWVQVESCCTANRDGHFYRTWKGACFLPPINRNPSMMVRVLAYLGDFSLGQLIFHGLISVGHVRALFEALRLVVPISGSGGDAIATLLAVYTITTIIRFYSTLILGVSIFQWFLGLSSSALGISGRLCSSARVAIEFILIPLLFPLLPLFAAKPSLIERLSTSLLKKGRGLRGIVGFMARPIVLGFIFLCFFAPLLRNLAVIEGVHVEFSEIPAAKIKHESDFTKFRFFPSVYFGFTTFGDLDADRFILLPQFEVTKEGSKTRIKPFLGIYDTKNDSLGYLKKESRIDWRALANLAQKGNPFFHSSYPFLSGELESSSSANFSEQALNELEELVIASLELSFENVATHVRKHGPFLGGYVDLRQALISLLDAGATPRADTVNLGNKKFLRFRQLFEEVTTIEKKYREILIPLSETVGSILRYEWDANLNSAIARRDFATSFFAQAEWGEAAEVSLEQDDFSPMTLIDYLLSTKLKPKERQKVQEYAYRWFWDKSRLALQTNNENLITWLSVTMNRVFLIGQGKESYKKLGKMFLMMRHALENKDYSFFDLDKKNNE